MKPDRLRGVLTEMGIVPRYLYRNFRQTERANKEAILRLLRKTRTGAPVRLLDCGCGDGSFTCELMAQVGASLACGIEGQMRLVQLARARGLLAIQSDLNRRLPFADETFDLVHSNQVIEHLMQTDQFVREVWRVLKPGGRLILSTNNLAAWHNIVSLLLGQQPTPAHISGEIVLGNSLAPMHGEAHPDPAESHYRVFAFEALREFLAYYGFREVSYSTVGFYPFPPPWASALCALDRRHGAYLLYAGLKPSVTS